jgi:SAM-dependent methyltransferase
MLNRLFVPNDNAIHLVLGVSSCGKSSFIDHALKNGLLPRNAKIVMAYEIGSYLPKGPCIIHYNLFRPFRNSLDNINNRLDSDPVLNLIFNASKRIKPYLLMSHKTLLLRRVLNRAFIESDLKHNMGEYRVRDVFELISHIDYVEFHRQWVSCLSKRLQGIKFINAETDVYPEYANLTELADSLREPRDEVFTTTQIKDILSKFQFGYHSINIKGDISTDGDDRSNTATIIKPFLINRSVLDIGCGYGFHCFETERYSSKTIIGTELKKERFLGANVIKTIKNSKVVFEFKNIFANDALPQFDTVLLLNIIHHLNDPIDAILKASKIAQRTLIIEFPGPNDHKFQKTLSLPHPISHDLPFIGVSLLGSQDQTFLFTKEAVRRILFEHNKLFANIEFVPSDVQTDRWIAICNK